MNASPIDLRLMLLDGLMRRIDEAGVALHDSQIAVALEAFAKARAIAEARRSSQPPAILEQNTPHVLE